MNKKVLLVAMAGALCCGIGISRADGTDSTKMNIPTPTQLQHQINQSPATAMLALHVADAQIQYAAEVGDGNYTGAIAGKDAPYLLAAYRKMTQSSTVIDANVGGIMLDYYRNKNNAESAAQASQVIGESAFKLSLIQTAQNQQLIDQNNKIIDLLTKLVNKK